LECVLAGIAAIVIARAYGMRERERVAQQLDGNEVETDGDSIIAVAQIVLGTGVFMTLCVLALTVELVLWLRHRRRLAPAR
jgi:hypothetical protein